MMPFFFGPRQITAEEGEGRRNPMEIRERLEETGMGSKPEEVECSFWDWRPKRRGREGPQMSMSRRPVCLSEGDPQGERERDRNESQPFAFAEQRRRALQPHPSKTEPT